MAPIKFAILTVSDTCASGEKTDASGPALKALINADSKESLLQGDVVFTAIVQDNEKEIMDKLIVWCDEDEINVIVTTGGTGFSKTDVTPEATKKIIDKEAPGLSLAMLVSSLKITPMAMLSRAVCGIRNKTLIINLPGSRKAAVECFNAIASAIPHAVDLLLDNKVKVRDTHNIIQHDITTCSHHISSPELINNIASRPRESPFPMISIDEAIKIINETLEEKEEFEIVEMKDAYGRISDKIYSDIDLPPFRASIKDGYAVLASDGKGKRKVLGGVNAGASPVLVSLKSGTCVRVNTGAPIPDEATAVVQVEDTKLLLKTSDEMEEEEIEILTEPKEGQDIRPIGCDIKKGSLVLDKYTRIGPVEMGLLATCGYKEVTVVKFPRVGVLSTGDELQEVGQPLKPGHIYDSNRILLISLLKENNFYPLDLGICPDNITDLVLRIQRALTDVDVLVTTGSVSMGDKDLLKNILKKFFNATIHFGRVNLKPGKPTTFATCKFLDKEKYILCLPGNPVSVNVTAHLFLLHILRVLCHDYSMPIIISAKLTSSYILDPRPEFVRAILTWDRRDPSLPPLAFSTENQSSSNLLSCKQANAFLMLPGRTEEKQMLKNGDIAIAMLINNRCSAYDMSA